MTFSEFWEAILKRNPPLKGIGQSINIRPETLQGLLRQAYDAGAQHTASQAKDKHFADQIFNTNPFGPAF